ncbi:hypothetical protein HYO62_00245 [Aerococcaceae bacterium DSM 111022]|nr:hypothetical protein [Aerococcaceae bacterium DSM 111022]
MNEKKYSLKELIQIRDNLDQMKWDHRLPKPIGFDSAPTGLGKRKKNTMRKSDYIFEAKNLIESLIKEKKAVLIEKYLISLEEINDGDN